MASNIPQQITRQSSAAQITTPRILSVQSHVVSGYCGNKSATFPLQLLEFEVDVINSVQLSNHTQYKLTKGQIFANKDLDDLHEGLKANNLLKLYDIILSGYVADVGYIESLAKLVQETKQVRKAKQLRCLYTFDPVLGDDGVGYYVPNGYNVAEAYKQYLLPLADIMTPNRFEASILSGISIDPLSPDVLEQAIKSMNIFHEQMGISTVVLTSLELASKPDYLTCIVSHDTNVQREEIAELVNQPRQAWSIQVKKLELPFTGTGDLFTALFTGWLQKSNFDLKQSLENTANSIHDILEDTMTWYKLSDDKSVQSFELRLIQNRDKIIKPSKKYQAQRLDISPSLSSN